MPDFHRLDERLRISLLDKPVRRHAPEIHRLRAHVREFLDLLPIGFGFLVHLGGRTDNPLHFPPTFITVLFQDFHGGRHRVNHQRVDAVFFRHRHGFHNLFIRVVVGAQRIDILQIATVCKVGEQIAAQQNAAD